MSKEWYKSKTLWIAILQFAVGGLVAIQGSHPEIGGLIIAKSIIDMALRIITTEPIK